MVPLATSTTSHRSLLWKGPLLWPQAAALPQNRATFSRVANYP